MRNVCYQFSCLFCSRNFWVSKFPSVYRRLIKKICVFLYIGFPFFVRNFIQHLTRKNALNGTKRKNILLADFLLRYSRVLQKTFLCFYSSCFQLMSYFSFNLMLVCALNHFRMSPYYTVDSLKIPRTECMI